MRYPLTWKNPPEKWNYFENVIVNISPAAAAGSRELVDPGKWRPKGARFRLK